MPKVLVVDDSATTRQQVRMLLARHGYQVLEASQAPEGLELLRRTELALLLCDVNMPGMNGLELLEHVRMDLRRTSLPVLMLTAEWQSDLLARARRAGAQGWVVKPFRADLLLAAVHKLTGHSESSRAVYA